MTRLAHKFWFWALVQCCVVAAILGWRFYVGTSEYLAHPTDGDLYAHTWSFQAISFSVFAVALFIGGMSILICLEWFVARILPKRQMIDERTSA